MDADRQAEPPTEGIEEADATTGDQTLVGTWAAARAVPCAGSGSPERVCIPGGFSILGDLDRSAETDIDRLESVPLRPARLSPMWMDRTEFTVGRLRSLVEAGTFSGELPLPYDPGDPVRTFCTWVAVDDSTNDSLPVNCVTWDTARQVCAAAGGVLPSEAQWEHAARGRGKRRIHPWGDEEATCCMTCASRGGFPGAIAACGGLGPEPVGSHEPVVGCSFFGDSSVDGVLDLAGNVSEASRDAFVPYSAGCWKSSHIPLDPVCEESTTANRVARGGSWNDRLTETAAPLRRLFREGSPAYGFRCAYDDSAQ